MDEKSLELYLKNLQPAKRGEKVLACLPDEFVQKSVELNQLVSDVKALHAKLMQKNQLAQAYSIIFWNEVKALSEMAESTEERGLSLGLRKKDDQVVLVEFKNKPQLPPFLKPDDQND